MTIRFVKTEYRMGRKIVKHTMSGDPNRAVQHCVGHMQTNEYGARTAEVYDADTNRLYAQLRLSASGKLTIDYEYSAGDWVMKGHLKNFRKHIGKPRG